MMQIYLGSHVSSSLQRRVDFLEEKQSIARRWEMA
jgi:hypothetical protein